MEHITEIRHNVMNISTIDAFESVKGAVERNGKDVLFVRALGVNASYLMDIQRIDDACTKTMNAKKGFYQRLISLPKIQNPEDISFYSACYEEWVNGGKKKMFTRETKKAQEMAVMLSEACLRIEGLYKQNNAQVSDSMMKNFMVKLLFWYDALFFDEKFNGDEKQSIKIIASNIVKKQEYLFFYMITLMGADVLLLQSREDISPAEEALGLSVMFKLGDFSNSEIPAYHWHETAKEPQVPQGNAGQSTAGSANATCGRITLKIPERNRPSRQKTQENPNPAATPATQTPPQARPVIKNPVHPSRTQSQRSTQIQSATPPGRTAPVQSTSDAEKSFEELAMLASSVVLIEVYDGKGERIGSGSGIMIGKDGYILTNNHVACGGRSFSVRIEDDDKEYRTDEIIKYHSLLDLAIIRIQRKLNPIPVYKGSKPLVRGQKVVAIGSPLGLFNSVSNGIISGFREIDDVDMIQFTAPISRGSSGGAVLNMQGEVIGISTAGIDAGQNINLAMGYECINMFIKGFI